MYRVMPHFHEWIPHCHGGFKHFHEKIKLFILHVIFIIHVVLENGLLRSYRAGAFLPETGAWADFYKFYLLNFKKPIEANESPSRSRRDSKSREPEATKKDRHSKTVLYSLYIVQYITYLTSSGSHAWIVPTHCPGRNLENSKHMERFIYSICIDFWFILLYQIKKHTWDVECKEKKK